MKLKIYTDLELLQVGFPVELLIPFIGTFNEEDKPGKMMSSRFDEFALRGKEFIELTTIEEADVCLLPVYYKLNGDIVAFEKTIQPFVEKVERSDKKTIVFVGHEIYTSNIKIKNCIILNSAVNKSNQPNNIFAWPYFFEDYIQQYYNNELILRKKSAVPVVGFRGFAPPLGMKLSKPKVIGILKLMANYIGIMKKYPAKASHSYRARAIIGLLKTKIVQTNIKIKPTFAFGPAGQLNTGNTVESDEAFRRNYVNNIIESDYILCVRGIGNNSIRFFESLCCGRIPIFLNTDSVLPFDSKIDWKSLCIWVEEKDIDNIDKVVLNFHCNISEKEFIELQKKLRILWEEYLSPVGFFKNLKLLLDLP